MRSITNIDALAHQVRVFRNNQIKPGMNVFLNLTLARPEEPRQSTYSTAKIFESLTKTRVSSLCITTQDREVEFPLDDLSAETFREFDGWHQSLSTLCIAHFKIKRVLSETFACFENLLNLNISDCGLCEIRVDAFKGLEKLTRLILSNN